MKRRAFIGGGLTMTASGLVIPHVSFATSGKKPVVETAQGQLRGITNTRGVNVFKGIRYGASTGGKKRFMPPVSPPTWAGVRDAFEYGDQAPQAQTRLAGSEPMSDDCLRLNVWTPKLDNKKRPVMLWFHGGGFEAGVGSMPFYDGTHIAHRGDVVVITINHRLNVFGHCYLGELLGEDFQQSGNVGFLDLIASMQWVKENISNFGGDPDNVMIYGQSGGGRKVSLNYASPLSQGLFHKGVVQSGSHLKVQTEEHANNLTENLLKELGIAKKDAIKLQSLDVNILSRVQRKVISAAGSRFSPMLDGITFPTQPWLPSAPAISSHLPMMLGTTRTELTNQMGGIEGIFDMNEAQAKARLKAFILEDDIDEAYKIFKASRPNSNPSEVFFKIASARGYVRDQTIMAEQRVKSGSKNNTYVYRLMWRQPVEGGRRISQHSLDLPFIFDTVAALPHITGPETEETHAMVNNMANSWIAFAKQGDPNNDSIPKWRPYDLKNRLTMMFDVPSYLENDPHKKERLFMADYPSQQDGGNALHRRAMSR
ncbi:MAG: carboxylesterase/lipase family protein [Cellvibrionaceae bacterium]